MNLDDLDDKKATMHRVIIQGNTCAYCGATAEHIDHVTPKSVVGNATLRVPACAECNMLAGAKMFETLAQKRAYIKSRLKQRYARLLKMPHWTDEELGELQQELRQRVTRDLKRKAAIAARIAYKSPLEEFSKPKDCRQCGKEFQGARDWQTFCSDHCRISHHRDERAAALKEYRKRTGKNAFYG